MTKENENSLVGTFYCEWNNINILDLYFQEKASILDKDKDLFVIACLSDIETAK